LTFANTVASDHIIQKINDFAIQSLANTKNNAPIKQFTDIFMFNSGANIAVLKHIANYKIILFYFLLDLIIMLFIRISLILFHLHSYDYVI